MSRGGADHGRSDAEMAAEAMSLSTATEEAPPLVPAGGVFEGQIAVVGETRIDGRVQGTLRGPGALVLGPEADVEGPIDCEGVVARGRIVGPVKARACVRLGRGTRLEGDVSAPRIEVDDEARWTGKARIGD